MRLHQLLHPALAVADATCEQDYCLGQSWLVAPAPLEDLRKAELEWGRLAAPLDTISANRRPSC